MEREKSKNLSIIIIILSIIIALLSVTFSIYAVFKKNGSFETEKKQSTTSIKGIVYRSEEPIILTDAVPGDKITSTFSVSNPNSKLKASYEINLKIDKNTFDSSSGNKELVLRVNSHASSKIEEIDLTDKNKGDSIKLITLNTLMPGEIQEYDLTLAFIDTLSIQDANINKDFIGHIEIVQSFDTITGQ